MEPQRELAFLANTLLAGCSLLARPFTIQEAQDAAVAICTLGFALRAARRPDADAGTTTDTETHIATRTKARTGTRTETRTDPDATPPTTALTVMEPGAAPVDRDVLIAFDEGWSALYEEVSLSVANRLIALLSNLQCVDNEIQGALYRLRRELVKQRDAGTPWRAGADLEALATLDLPAWTSVVGLLGECPVMPAALTAIVERQTGAISATAFDFISTPAQIRQIHTFLDRLPELLLGAA